MIDVTLFQLKHQLWLRIAFTSFAINDPVLKNRLYEFSQIEFRHLKWLAQSLYENAVPYTFERDAAFGIHGERAFELIQTIVRDIRSLQMLYGSLPLHARMEHDETYILRFLDTVLQNHANDHALSAFNRKRVWPHASLNADQSDALTLFLFEESYKEYELILVYFHRQIRASTPIQSISFQDLIDESHFHLRSFGEMMAAMGILAFPRPLHPKTYEIGDMEAFLRNGIVEEENAKEECRRLSSSISDPELSAFFEFINHQESYHIEIMKRLLQERLWKN